MRDYKMLKKRSNATWYAVGAAEATMACMTSSEDTFLFDVANDPRERFNLAGSDEYASVVASFEDRLAEIVETEFVPRTAHVASLDHDATVINAFTNSASGEPKHVAPWGCAMS